MACAPSQANTDDTDDTDALDDTAAPCPSSGSGDFDVERFRVGGLSMPASYDSVVAVLGEGECVASGYYAACSWSSVGTRWTFLDCDQDGAPDPDPSLEYGSLCYLSGQDVRFVSPYPGTTRDGLGIGVTRACWRASLGQNGFPDAAMDEWETLYQQFVYVTYDGVGRADSITMQWHASSE